MQMSKSGPSAAMIALFAIIFARRKPTGANGIERPSGAQVLPT
jgi:hypothetical protein